MNNLLQVAHLFDTKRKRIHQMFANDRKIPNTSHCVFLLLIENDSMRKMSIHIRFPCPFSLNHLHSFIYSYLVFFFSASPFCLVSMIDRHQNTISRNIREEKELRMKEYTRRKVLINDSIDIYFR